MSDIIDRMNLYYEVVDYCHEKGYLFEVDGRLEHAIENIILEAPTVDAEPVRHGRWITEAIIPTHATETIKVIGRCSECGCYDAICNADAVGYYKGNPIIWAGFITNYKGNERLAEEFALTKAGNREKNKYCPNCGARMDEKETE